ncbi:hypothetical protein BDZ97DRAFT_2015119 [Flammula alnicola]|nr:hypothetical protein BDZ97DRAFT_2015119 [Flammula alnicola]
MRECGTPGVPSFSALRKLQSRLVKEADLQPKHHTSSLGNNFYMNHPLDLLALDWANPLVREHIHIYPEVCDTISESWQAEKWLNEVNLDELSPMWADWKRTKHRHFYVKEVAQLEDGSFVVPMRWIIFKKEEYFDCYRVRESEETGKYYLFGHSSESQLNGFHRLPVTELKYNYLELQSGGFNFDFSENDSSLVGLHNLGCAPHPLRKIAKNKPLFSLRIMPWCDDVSGNRSKQYNPHVNVYTTNTCLPHQKLSQEYFVRFCSTSTHASALEQFDALAQDFGKWKEAYDCKLEQEILFQIFPHALPADNPQQAESCSCGGLGGSHNCRYDENGGSKEYKETDEGYHSMFEPGNPRSPEKTIEIINKQIETACLGVQAHVDQLFTATGIKDKIACHWMDRLVNLAREKQSIRISDPVTCDTRLKDKTIKGAARDALKQTIRHEIQQELLEWVYLQPPDRYEKLPEDSDGRKNLRPGDHFNVLLRIRGLNPHQDSPCEILHTFLLGQDKYIWHDTSTKWDKKKDEIFAVRLQSSSLDGLSITSLRPRYCVQYKKSLIGKHFKALQQLGIFHLDESLCSEEIFELWKATGELGAMLWFPEIKDMKQYLADLEILIANVLDLWAIHDPNRILVKFKLHVLVHLVDDIRRLGPAVLFSTEVFECWNAIFRLCSVLSNHLSPSHDIADTIIDMERFKHQVSGGWWKSTDGKWVQAGVKVRKFLKESPELQRRLGWADLSKIIAGSVKLQAKKKRSALCWKESLDQYWTEARNDHGERHATWSRCIHVISQSHDICKEGSWIFAKCILEAAPVIVGRIARILTPSTSDKVSQNADAVVILDIFELQGEKDSRMNMPVLIATQRSAVVAAKDILFLFNAQHDCFSANCKPVNAPILQERKTTTKMQAIIKHVNMQRYFVNMHALHNAHLLRETLPRHLTEPKLIFADRRSKHKESATILRVTGPAKRADAVAKAAETRNKRKQQQNVQEHAQRGRAVEHAPTPPVPAPVNNDSSDGLTVAMDIDMP